MPVKSSDVFDKSLYVFTDRSGNLDRLLNATIREAIDWATFFDQNGVPVEDLRIERVPWKQPVPSKANPTQIPVKDAAKYGFSMDEPLYLAATVGEPPYASGTTVGMQVRAFKRNPFWALEDAKREYVSPEV